MKYILLLWVFSAGYSFHSFTVRKIRMIPIWRWYDYIAYFLEYVLFAPLVILIDLFYWFEALLQK